MSQPYSHLVLPTLVYSSERFTGSSAIPLLPYPSALIISKNSTTTCRAGITSCTAARPRRRLQTDVGLSLPMPYTALHSRVLHLEFPGLHCRPTACWWHAHIHISCQWQAGTVESMKPAFIRNQKKTIFLPWWPPTSLPRHHKFSNYYPLLWFQAKAAGENRQVQDWGAATLLSRLSQTSLSSAARTVQPVHAAWVASKRYL